MVLTRLLLLTVGDFATAGSAKYSTRAVPQLISRPVPVDKHHFCRFGDITQRCRGTSTGSRHLYLCLNPGGYLHAPRRTYLPLGNVYNNSDQHDPKDSVSIQRRPVSDGNVLSRRISNAVILSRRPSRPSPLAGPALSSDSQEDGEEQDVSLSKVNADRASSALSATLPFPVARSRDISRRASMPTSILITNSGHGIGYRDRGGNCVEEAATARMQRPRVIYMDDLKSNQRRPHSVVDSLPMTRRPLSSQPRPRPVSDLMMPTAVSQASQSNGIYRSSSMNVTDSSNSSMRTLIDAYGDARSSTITLLDSPSATRAGNLSHSPSANMLKSTDSSLRKLADVKPDHLRVPTLAHRRHSLMLPSGGENKPRPGFYRAPSSATSWSSSDSFQNQMTPTFTRQGLSGAGVVLPLTVKEYQRQQKMKDREGRLAKSEPSFPGIRRLRTRHSDAGHGRASSIRSKRGSIYLPSVASVFSTELLRGEGEKDVKGHDGITRLGSQVEDLVQVFEKKSTEAQDHVDRCKHDEAGTMVAVENAQPSPTKAKKHRAGPVGACRRYFTAIFVRSPKPGPSAISGVSSGSKAHRQTVKAVFSNIVIRK